MDTDMELMDIMKDITVHITVDITDTRITMETPHMVTTDTKNMTTTEFMQDTTATTKITVMDMDMVSGRGTVVMVTKNTTPTIRS